MALPIFQKVIVNEVGDVVPSCIVTVLDEATGVAPAGGIFSDRNGTTPLGSGGVFTADADGTAEFYASAGEYRVTASDAGSGFSETLRFVPLVGTSALLDTGTAAGEVPTNGDLTDYYQRSNILAAVSQSGGVPTGGIIERGSNANGEYVLFADGTSIMTLADFSGVDITSSRGTGGVFNIALPVNDTVPVDMVGGVATGFINDTDSPNVWGGVKYISTSTVEWQALFYESLASRTIRATIISRWF